jgi:hypothetical protein
MIKLIVPSIKPMDTCITSNCFVRCCPDKVALPKGKVLTVRKGQRLLVSNGWGAWLNDMANESELSMTHRQGRNKPKDTGLELKGTQSDSLEPCGVTRTQGLPVYRQSLSRSLSLTQNTVSPYSFCRKAGKRAVRQAEWGAGKGLWKKRMSFCNGMNTDLNVIRCESRQTSTTGNSLQETYRTF